jgi:hypothetical protein
MLRSFTSVSFPSRRQPAAQQARDVVERKPISKRSTVDQWSGRQHAGADADLDVTHSLNDAEPYNGHVMRVRVVAQNLVESGAIECDLLLLRIRLHDKGGAH